MSDEVKATNFTCCDDRSNDWGEWLIILLIVFFLLGGNNFFGRR
ncbi:MAG TPA: hypothetical protein PLV23_08550 [Sedimentibacter sp.]|jgi:hypothetical protein|nr:twin-arginine translocase TatA/TatE family subunit [Sedimentibacter sp.]HOK50003.1 hypothetical protein [Sedimentibacter sp.]HOW23669.1 hypothetical protein [Sedimentibacter sp.]HRC80710.1 hypothetical protein [Sedimentibacter sp.]